VLSYCSFLSPLLKFNNDPHLTVSILYTELKHGRRFSAAPSLVELVTVGRAVGMRNARRYWNNGLLLLVLYAIQGFPIGIGISCSMLLQARGASFAEQATFGLCSLPYSFKLLWAPAVDALYTTRAGLGQRKFWIIISQLGIGGILLGCNIDAMIGNELTGVGESPGAIDIGGLTLAFFVLYALAATQDIAVDAWALILLSPDAVGYAPAANAVGQTLGIAISCSLFMLLNSAKTCNAYLREPFGYPTSASGLLSMRTFMQIVGATIIAATLLVWVYKHETRYDVGLPVQQDNRRSSGYSTIVGRGTVVQAYLDLWKVALLKPVQRAAVILLTSKVAFAAVDSSAALVMQARGLPRETLASFRLITSPATIVFQVLISRVAAGPAPLTLFMRTYPLRLAYGVALLCVLYGGVMNVPDGHGGVLPPSLAATATLLGLTIVHHGLMAVMRMALMSFFTRISDPAMGGSYVTLFNTLINLGTMWPHWPVMQAMGALTSRVCVESSGAVPLSWIALLPSLYPSTTPPQRADPSGSEGVNLLLGQPCPDATSAAACVGAGGHCATLSDGFLALVILSTVGGVAWWLFVLPFISRLQCTPKAAWHALSARDHVHALTVHESEVERDAAEQPPHRGLQPTSLPRPRSTKSPGRPGQPV
jgi:MFS transporter, PAT family, solute carrier family 33 (acetyl-CoA transportor), member 1